MCRMHLVVEDEQKAHRSHDGHDAAIAGDSNDLTPMTLQTSGTSRVACSTPTFGRGTDLGRVVAAKEESLHYAGMLLENARCVYNALSGAKSTI